MAVIYKATNTVNGKEYIGFALDLERRKRAHYNRANRGDGEYFHNAIRKYGFDAFEWAVLKEEATLDDEILLIEQHGTYENGYNLTKGGEGKLGCEVTEETKQKISKARKKQVLTENQIRALRENAKRMKERGHTPEARAKISEANKNRKFTKEHRANISKNHAAYKETGAYYQSEEYKEKMSKACKGKTRTPEQKERYRQAALKREKAKREQQ